MVSVESGAILCVVAFYNLLKTPCNKTCAKNQSCVDQNRRWRSDKMVVASSHFGIVCEEDLEKVLND